MVKNWGNRRAENNKEFFEKLLKNLPDRDTNLSIKVHFFYITILINFRIIVAMWVMSKREQFRQDIKTMEECNQGRWDERMMTEYCWSIKNDLNNIEYDNQGRKNFHHSSKNCGESFHEGFFSAD